MRREIVITGYPKGGYPSEAPGDSEVLTKLAQEMQIALEDQRFWVMRDVVADILQKTLEVKGAKVTIRDVLERSDYHE